MISVSIYLSTHWYLSICLPIYRYLSSHWYLPSHWYLSIRYLSLDKLFWPPLRNHFCHPKLNSFFGFNFGVVSDQSSFLVYFLNFSINLETQSKNLHNLNETNFHEILRVSEIKMLSISYVAESWSDTERDILWNSKTKQLYTLDRLYGSQKMPELYISRFGSVSVLWLFNWPLSEITFQSYRVIYCYQMNKELSLK